METQILITIDEGIYVKNTLQLWAVIHILPNLFIVA